MRLFIFGLGYTVSRLATQVRGTGWSVTGTSQGGRTGTIAFDDQAGVEREIGAATHILSSVPPGMGGDPVLERYGKALGHAAWLGYLSSTGVYGDTGGAWVDETATPHPTQPRSIERLATERAWQELGEK